MSDPAEVPANRVIEVCRRLATFSESPDNITRTYLSPPVREVHRYLQEWMEKLGMGWRVDAIGNLRGVYRSPRSCHRRLLIGSHIDTVPNAGAFDGVLGVVLALALIECLSKETQERINFDIEVIAFSEEEGVRFAAPFLGSRALLGEIDDALLRRRDINGQSLAEAIEAFGLDVSELPEASIAGDVFAFLEIHIEQGPVLEANDRSLGVVERIAGQSRYEILFQGKAGHAGTTPMLLRRDALAGAAEWVLRVEEQAVRTAGLVATIGQLAVTPCASNVIPEEARLSLDIRHADDLTRSAAAEVLLQKGSEIALARRLGFQAVQHSQQASTPMDSSLVQALVAAVSAAGVIPHRLMSGAGHDAMVLARRVPAAMLFLRSPDGVSHHPDESVLPGDVQAALDAGLYFLKHL